MPSEEYADAVRRERVYAAERRVIEAARRIERGTTSDGERGRRTDMRDVIEELIEAAQRFDASPVGSDFSYTAAGALVQKSLAAKAAGYPALRAKELAVIDAALAFSRGHGKRPRCHCRLCAAVRALDAATPKDPTDG